MSNEFLWEKAKKIDSSLEGANWPENLTLPQIAKQRFPNDESDEKALLRLLNKKVEDGSLEFCAIKVNSKWHWPNVSYSIAGNYGRIPGLQESNIKRMEGALLKEHEPVCGWLEALKGVELNNPIKLEQHLCGCDSECTMEKTYHNGLPKRWRVEGVHEDGLKINFSCQSEPLLSENQCRDFLCAIGQPIPTDSILNGWGGDLKMQFQTGVNDDTKNQAVTEQSSAKAIQSNSNEFAFSGLLHQPNGKDDWFEVIDVMTKAFYSEHNAMPTKAQARTRLWKNPPEGYGITVDTDNCLRMSGFIKPFNIRSFGRRWNNYTAKSNPFKPN